MKQKFSLGIDLGTTNTYVAININDKTELIRFKESPKESAEGAVANFSKVESRQFPTVVDLETGQVGQHANTKKRNFIREKKEQLPLLSKFRSAFRFFLSPPYPVSRSLPSAMPILRCIISASFRLWVTTTMAIPISRFNSTRNSWIWKLFL